LANRNRLAGIFVRLNFGGVVGFYWVGCCGCGVRASTCAAVGSRLGRLWWQVFLILSIARAGLLGLRLALNDDEDRDYLAVCDYVREHTPLDAVFVVPPNEQLFRYRAQRAIVVNFKECAAIVGGNGGMEGAA